MSGEPAPGSRPTSYHDSCHRGRRRPPPRLPPEITIGVAPTDQQPVALPDSSWNPETGLAEGEAWPPACQLVTDAVEQQVLPRFFDVVVRGMS